MALGAEIRCSAVGRQAKALEERLVVEARSKRGFSGVCNIRM